MIILPSAPRLHGSPQEQLDQLQRYVIELTEALEIQLNNINYTSFDEETRKKIGG